MSTICLAAQRSFNTGEAVWFSYRLPALHKIVFRTLACLCCLGAVLIAGLYAHIYWNLQHPAPAPKPVSVAQPDTQLSDMHYVYISKPFPEPKPKVAEYTAPPLPSDDPLMMDKSLDWQQAPDNDISSEPLPDTHIAQQATDSDSLKERFMQALKEQQQDYSQGKIPDAPVDETQDDSETNNRVINQTVALKTEKIDTSMLKKSPQALTHGDLRNGYQ
ncbi:hypothetical protein [Leclercia sp.]|uniref:hypothetical protein n=1 Tax=Leclercia sp. TaxID=1898428 RepID=UPI001FEFFAC8|nr:MULTISPECIES: hypothetical protein [unclassified Leclercia]WNY87974.1 hypothetical protein NRF19_03280 [Leclercia adecarboxylata]